MTHVIHVGQIDLYAERGHSLDHLRHVCRPSADSIHSDERRLKIQESNNYAYGLDQEAEFLALHEAVENGQELVPPAAMARFIRDGILVRTIPGSPPTQNH